MASRITRKWWHKILCYVIDVCVSNAHVLFEQSRNAARLRGVPVPDEGRVSRRKFIAMILQELLEEFEARAAQPSPSTPDPMVEEFEARAAQPSPSTPDPMVGHFTTQGLEGGKEDVEGCTYATQHGHTPDESAGMCSTSSQLVCVAPTSGARSAAPNRQRRVADQFDVVCDGH